MVKGAKQLESEINEAIRLSEEQEYQDFLSSLEQLDFQKRTRQFFQKLRSRTKSDSDNFVIKNAEGSLSKSPEEFKENWAQFYERLYEGHREPTFDARPVENQILDRPL